MLDKKDLIKIADDFGFSCGEDFYQNDEVNETLPEILEFIYSKEFGDDWDIKDLEGERKE